MFELIIFICIFVGIRAKLARTNTSFNKDLIMGEGKKLLNKVKEAIPMDERPSAQPNKPRKEHGRPKTDTYTSTAPRKKPSFQKMQDRGQDIMNKVNQHIYGTDASKADLLLYKTYLEGARQTDIRKMAREMECTMYQVISDIKDFQKMGYFTNVEVDDVNYKIRYKDEPYKPASYVQEDRPRPAKRQESKKTEPVKKEDPIKKHEPHGSASVRITDCDDCGTSKAKRARTNPYMTMPEHGLEIGYMTMTDEYTVGYMTMPEHGLEISYNTIPDFLEE